MPETSALPIRQEDDETDASRSAGTTEAAAGAPEDDAVMRLIHDLRNPLNTISMNAELVALVAADTDAPGELADGLAALERAVGELERGLERLASHVTSTR